MKSNRQNSKKHTKKKTARTKKVRVFSTSKRRNKDVYDVKLPRGHRSSDDLRNIINKVKLNVSNDLIENGQVKITLVARKGYDTGSITLIHDIDDKQDLRDSIIYTNDWIFRKLKPGEVVKNKNVKYLSPGNPLNNYVNQIIIDFETNE